ncbi:MAG: tetratricopeptide repeat protein [Candidatus Methylomirabilis oxyfera]|nr:tetratricopeptide repeat protein [Candidatus Methylomirabilis oxyfera]
MIMLTTVNRARIWLLLSFILVVPQLHMPLASAAEGCGALVRKDQKSTARRVYLTGGNAWELFERYLDEAKKQGVDVAPWTTRVVVSNGRERAEYELHWTARLTGQGVKDVWSGRLRSVTAEVNEAGYQHALRQQWDIVCYTGEGTSMPTPASTQKPAASSTPTQARETDASLAARQKLDSGIQYAAHRDFENAIKEFTAAIQQYPQYGSAYANRGVVYMQQKKYNKAMTDLKKAEELSPKDKMVYYNLMALYCAQNQRDQGIDALDKTLELGFSEYDVLRKDPDLANCRLDPDFRKVLEKHKVFLQ